MPAPSPSALSVIGVGASAGGVEALRDLFHYLPRHIDAAILVVLHLPAHSPSRLVEVLATVSPLALVAARDGARIQPGHVYVATPDRHLLLEGDHLRLTRGPKECRMRPAIDVMFRSLAVTCGPRAAGVVLSGMLDDGTAGLWAIKEHGGATFVQDPMEALHRSMPESAIDNVPLDLIAPVAQLAPALVDWSRGAADVPARLGAGASPHLVETRIAAEANGLRQGVMNIGRPSKYSCPDCHGCLLEIQEGRVVRYRCHTGHAFSIQTLMAEVDNAIDNGLWESIRAMEERLMLLRQIAAAAETTGEPTKAARFTKLASELEKPIEGLRTLVLADSVVGHESV